ncbi:hypothetical protein EZV62_009606 [Acer yangbiense]|uniref:Protein transport protein sec16 n=1 Tax=Acer yangbiense TaxID=1000413 RepID=A0A5C7I2H0_9ROSI|nr:hypothetical protein EZV62_009606 [Acer yangbiense]
MMASSPFELDDQTDEDFFDRLVNDDDDDEINVSGSGVSLVKADVTDEARAFSNLSISEVGLSRVVSDVDFDFSVEDSNDGVILASVNAKEDTVVVEESNAVIASSVNESSEVGLASEECKLDDGVMDGSDVCTGTGLKEVQWSSFDSISKVDGGSELRSDLDFFGEFGDNNSGDPFANLDNTDNLGAKCDSKSGVLGNTVANLGSSDYGKNQDAQNHGQSSEHNVDGQDLSSSQYWENLYPGWRYDPNTGEWHQLDGYVADSSATVNASAMESVVADAQSGHVLEQGSDVYNLQQTALSEFTVGRTVVGATDFSVSNWNQTAMGTADYPAHMVFDPQYPGWYYDTITQDWRSLESYTQAINKSTASDSSQQFENNNVENYGSQNLGGQYHVKNWGGSASNYNEKITDMWQTQPVDESETTGFTENKQLENPRGSTAHVNSFVEQQTGFMTSGTVASHELASWGVSVSQSFSTQQFSPQHNQSKMEASQQILFNPSYVNNQKPVNFQPQQIHSRNQFPYAPSESRSSAGRPPHALVTFGFGGKLVVLKNNRSFDTNSTYGSKDSLGGVINVLNLMDVVMEKTAASGFGLGTCDYLHTLCQQSFPGPLVGGNFGNKELNRWIDERIANCESPNDYENGEVMSLLFSLLKIAYQYYGKLRSPFGTDPVLKESDCAESAVAKLFGSAKRNDFQMSYYGPQTYCLQNLPAEAQIQATTLEVQKLLVSGRKKEALECAREGQLWGPALVLASQFGDQLYGDTLKQMAIKQLVAGSPLRTLCLLIAGQPADVFSNDAAYSIIPASVNTFQQPVQSGANFMLDNWEENLAIITANRTKGDELVVVHLGDCLWKERGEVAAAHACYLVADSNFEPYSDSARLCLIGADHWKFPRTYASPQAIQRTELYEYAKVLGNPQFLLLPFQPYKLIYAHMLAEVGKVADSLKYCQAIMKSLKTGRSPEVDTWKQLVMSLEERLRTHQQSGYTSNFPRTNLFGKFITFVDNTANRVVGSVPPPVPSQSHSNFVHNEFAHQPGGLQVSSSQSTMVMPPLMPHASVEHTSGWTDETNRLNVPDKSMSEPDFDKKSQFRIVDSSNKTIVSKKQEKASASGGSSRFGRFGSQLLRNTVGLVLKARPHREAKLGEKNTFYYDEKLKRWVEEGAETPAEEEAALAPPPTFSVFQNGNNVNAAPKIESFQTISGTDKHSPITSDQSPGIPPIPPSSNQFSSRGKMGVRTRYVDTFNKGGGTPANLFQSPAISSSKPGAGSNPKFFIPTPVSTGKETVQTTGESIHEAAVVNENPPTSLESFAPPPTTVSSSAAMTMQRSSVVNKNLPTPLESFSPPPTIVSSSAAAAMTMQRFPSVDNIIHKKTGVMADDRNLFPSNSRRAASWSGSLSDAGGPVIQGVQFPGETLAPTASFYADPLSNQLSEGGNSSDGLHQIEL